MTETNWDNPYEAREAVIAACARTAATFSDSSPRLGEAFIRRIEVTYLDRDPTTVDWHEVRRELAGHLNAKAPDTGEGRGP